MKYKIVTTINFQKDFKKLFKKYKSLKKDILDLSILIGENPNLGTPLGKNCFKIRMAIGSKSGGKSGGARIVTCVKIVKETVFLVSIYDKSEIDNITDDELNRRLEGLN
ncbi:MAG: type II toxin-antitoxin system RelE/ParE family toxin [Leadbetterella sp.]|nr:type II toxin-antitoxin system RelE/ParE family toxin [Leadbetterella sp.]